MAACRCTAALGPLWMAWPSAVTKSTTQTALHPAMVANGVKAHEVLPGLAWQNEAGNVLGLYLHGLFEDPAVLQALFGASAPTLDGVFNHLADFLAQHTAPGVLDELISN